MAPTYANLFMDRLERTLISEARIKPYLWLRYINDVFMVWTGSEQELIKFLNYINERTRPSNLRVAGLKREWILWMFKYSSTKARLRRTFTQSRQININISFTPHVIPEGADKVFHMLKTKTYLLYRGGLRKKKPIDLKKYLVTRGYRSRFVQRLSWRVQNPPLPTQEFLTHNL